MESRVIMLVVYVPDSAAVCSLTPATRMERTAQLSAGPSNVAAAAATVNYRALPTSMYVPRFNVVRARGFAPAVMLMSVLMLPDAEYLAGTETMGTAKMPLKHAGTITP
jgi:hypothetical protein